MVRSSFVALRSAAHPNAAARLDLRLADLTRLEAQATDLQLRLLAYRAPVDPLLDTRPQLFSELRDVADALQFLRTTELPAFLATSPSDAYVSAMLEGLFAEAGISGVHPVASVHQGSWFATVQNHPTYPLMLAPAQILSDAGELPLFFHEIGHVLYRLWGPAFDRVLVATVQRTVDRLAQEARNAGDPNLRSDRAKALTEWQPQAYGEVEEIACDLVGALIGGPPFAVALHVALLMPDATPFAHSQPEYPPLDVRMRLAVAGIRRLGIADPAVDQAEESWKHTLALYSAAKPRFYDWLYTPTTIADLTQAVADFLTSRGVGLFAQGCSGIRGELARGTGHLLVGGSGYRAWSDALLVCLRSAYATFTPGGRSSSER